MYGAGGVQPHIQNARGGLLPGVLEAGRPHHEVVLNLQTDDAGIPHAAVHNPQF